MVLFYLVYSYEGVDRIKTLVTAGKVKKELSNMRVLINDTLDNIEVGDIEKAYMIYSEIQLLYEKSNATNQTMIYDEIIDLIKVLDMAYINNLIKNTTTHLKQDELDEAVSEFNKIKSIFDSLEKEEQQRIFEKIVKLHNGIQEKLNGSLNRWLKR